MLTSVNLAVAWVYCPPAPEVRPATDMWRVVQFRSMGNAPVIAPVPLER